MQEFLAACGDFFSTFMTEILLSLLMGCGVVSFCLQKAQMFFYLKSVGIKRIHKQGNNIRSMKKAITGAKEIKLISFMPYFFIRNYQELLRQKLKDGCRIKLLVCSKDSPTIAEICRLQRRGETDIADEFDPLMHLLTSIKAEAGPESTGVIEVRTYHTEIRNPAIIYINDRQTAAFVTVSLIPKYSTDSVMLEYSGKGCRDVELYFDRVWELHKEDRVLIL